MIRDDGTMGDNDGRTLAVDAVSRGDTPDVPGPRELLRDSGADRDGVDGPASALPSLEVRVHRDIETAGANRPTVRRYRKEDIPAIVEIVAVAIPLLPNYQFVKVHRGRLTDSLKKNIPNMSYMMNVLEDGSGVIGGASAQVYPTDFSLDVFAMDRFLFVIPEKRTLFNVNMLLRAYITWAKARGATIIQASQTSGIKPEAFAVLLQRQGFRHVGGLYQLIQGA